MPASLKNPVDLSSITGLTNPLVADLNVNSWFLLNCQQFQDDLLLPSIEVSRRQFLGASLSSLGNIEIINYVGDAIPLGTGTLLSFGLINGRNTSVFDSEIKINGSIIDNVDISSHDITARVFYDSIGNFAMGYANGAPLLPGYSTVATPTEGQIAFDYTAHTLKYYNGTIWV